MSDFPCSSTGLSRYASSGPFSARKASAICMRKVEKFMAGIVVAEPGGPLSVVRGVGVR